jgi:hypothetical protein
MRRTAKAFALVGGAVLLARVLVARLKPHERLMARCEQMFQEMPEDFPPKRIMRGVDEIRANSARTLELLEEREAKEPGTAGQASSAEAVHAT